MNKNANNRDIKRRLIALLTIAVFVFVIGFCPASTVVAADTDQTENIESTEAIQDIDASEEETYAETDDETEGVMDEPATEKVNNKGSREKGMGRVDVPEVKEKLSIKEGEEPSYLKKKESKIEKALEPLYDSRNMTYYKNRVQMLDQGDTGTCWAHSIATTAQISYLKELYSNSALGSKNYQLAPYDFAYNFYHRVPYKKYGYTTKDKNIPVRKNWKRAGGNNWMSSLALGSWMGMHAIENSSYADSNAYNNSLILENAKWINDIYKEVKIGRYYYDCYTLDQTLVKQAIKDYGAVSVAINMEEDYYNDEDDSRTWRGKRFNSFNCDYTFEYDYGYRDYIGTTNHEVVLVGWDNDFPKEYFTKQPKNNGAWIMQNSWGTKDEEGNQYLGGGFWYVSYEDLSLCSAVALDMQPADTYDANYQYDGNADFFAEIDVDTGDLLGNIFTVPDDGKRHTVEAVGFMAWNNYLTKYKVKIYKGVTGKPTNGTLAATINVKTESPGEYTFKLSDYGASPINLNTGEKYSVVVEATQVTDEDEGLALGVEIAENCGWIKFQSTGKKGTSYYYCDGKWRDIYKDSKSASLRIKGFTTTVDRISLNGAEITLPQNNYDCTGKQIKPVPTKVKLQGKALVQGEDYTLSYGKNKYPGSGTVKVIGKGLYKSSATKKFNIAGVNNFQQTAATTKTVTLGWDQSPKVKGYKIYKKKGSKFKLIKTISKSSTVKFMEKKLKADKEYQYKIRTFKKVGKKTYNGPISNAIIVRTEAIPEP